MAAWKYKKNDFVKTYALQRFRNENNLTFTELAEKTGESPVALNRWCVRGKAPKQVLDKLGIKARNTKADNVNHIKGGSFYACYVGAEHKAVFETFCKSLGISAKFVV